MNSLKILFLELFKYLKHELKVEIDFVQYEQFLHLFISGTWQASITATNPAEKEIQTKEALKNLCISLWVPHKKYLYAFNNYYDRIYNEQIFSFSGLVFHQDNEEINDYEEATNTIPEEILPFDGNQEEDTNKATEITDLSNKEEDISTVNIFVDISQDEGGGHNAIVEKKEKPTSALDTPFIFSDDKHLPFPNRKAQQLWRKLNSVTQRVEGYGIDIKSTVRKFSKQRILLEPVRNLEKKGSLNTILFIEHDGSMIAFQSWWDQLKNQIKESNKNGSLEVFYFNNYPLPVKNAPDEDYHLFINTSHTQSKKLSEIQKNITKDTLVLFFSDAGALNHNISDDRINYSIKFIQKLQDLSLRILWLNPTPKDQWTNTAANIIALVIDMVTYDLHGLEKGIKILRAC